MGPLAVPLDDQNPHSANIFHFPSVFGFFVGLMQAGHGLNPLEPPPAWIKFLCLQASDQPILLDWRGLGFRHLHPTTGAPVRPGAMNVRMQGERVPAVFLLADLVAHSPTPFPAPNRSTVLRIASSPGQTDPGRPWSHEQAG